MPEAQYVALLARAVPALSVEQILGSPVREVPGAVPLARGWALIHASCLLHGEPMVWPGSMEERGQAYIDQVTAALTRQREQRRRGRDLSQSAQTK